MTRTFIAPLAAAVTLALVPQVPQLAAVGGVGKLLVGGAGAWFTRSMEGPIGAVAFGASIGLAVDGAFDFIGFGVRAAA